eukprot:16401_1
MSTQQIMDKHLFWQQIGFQVNDDDDELISIIAKHPLLLQHCMYKNQTILQRLVVELKIMNVLEKYILNNPKTVMDQLLNQVKECEEQIDVQNRFWNRVSRLLNNDKSILFSLHHSLLWENCGYKDKTVLQRLEEELMVNLWQNLVMNDDIKIQYLFHKLTKTKTKISNKQSFWEQCQFVVDNNSKLMLMIAKHPLLFKTSDYRTAGESDHSTIFERFVEELKLNLFDLMDNADIVAQLMQYLVKRIKTKTNKITDQHVLFKHFHYFRNNKIHDIISRIKIQYPLLLTNFKMQIKFIEELELGLEVLDDDDSKIEYLMQRLLTYQQPINEKHSLFKWTKYTVNKNAQLISKIRKHSLLSQSSKYKVHGENMSILERFVEELKINLFDFMDNADIAQYLVKRIKTKTNKITDQHVLFKHFHYFRNNKIHDIISRIKIQYPLLLTNFKMQIKFIEELELGLEVL